jgi:dTDP-glucose 4,6-dehydratase
MLNIVTGGAGFIGRALVEELLLQGQPVLVVDALTYASKRENLPPDSDLFSFLKMDICESGVLNDALHTHMKFSSEKEAKVFHLAAESHVDRSIESGQPFMRSNVLGTQSLLEGLAGLSLFKFLHVSTDEVYGSVSQGESLETSKLNPSSPYAASKAASDLVVQSFAHTHGLDFNITRCANNYGEDQLPEKLIPRLVHKAIQGEPLPVYGDGSQIREWLHVSDHVSAILKVMEEGAPSEIYNIGSQVRIKNIEIAELILKATGSDSKIQFVEDRKGHDFRYALNSQKIGKELGWKPNPENSLLSTIDKMASRIKTKGLDPRFKSLEELHDR